MNGWSSSVRHQPQAPLSCCRRTQPGEPGPRDAIEHAHALGRRQLQLVERAHHEQVRHEARDRLFGTAVGVVRRGRRVRRAAIRPSTASGSRPRCAPAGLEVSGIERSTVRGRACGVRPRHADVAPGAERTHRDCQRHRVAGRRAPSPSPVSVADPGAVASKAHSVRASPPVGTVTVWARAGAARLEAGRGHRHRAPARRRPPGSCGRWPGTRTSSRSVRKRGGTTRSSRSRVVIVRATAMPTCVSRVTARAVRRQVVSESG